MKDKINEICNKLNREQLSVYGATNELFDLFVVSQQRERLNDFVSKYNTEIEKCDPYYKIDNDFIDDYLKGIL